MKKKSCGMTPLPLMICYDLLAIGVGLIVFALFHHVLLFRPDTEPVVLVTPAPTAAPITETEKESVEALPLGDFSRQFADQFTEGEVYSAEEYYVSDDLAIYYWKSEKDKQIYHVAEIYVRDIHCLQTAFSSEEYFGAVVPFAEIAEQAEAVAALSGDYYRGRKEGVVVRNGVLYRDTENEDVCILRQDGVMECFSAEEFDPAFLRDRGVWQAWGFGPTLVKDGAPVDNSTHALNAWHPRSAIGYAEPGHYFFVEVEGRSAYSRGMTFEELSELFVSLGCTEAYNLDGGESANFYWQGERRNPDLGRPVADIIYVSENWEDQK